MLLGFAASASSATDPRLRLDYQPSNPRPSVECPPSGGFFMTTSGSLQVLDDPLGGDLRHVLVGLMRPLFAAIAQGADPPPNQDVAAATSGRFIDNREARLWMATRMSRLSWMNRSQSTFRSTRSQQ